MNAKQAGLWMVNTFLSAIAALSAIAMVFYGEKGNIAQVLAMGFLAFLCIYERDHNNE